MIRTAITMAAWAALTSVAGAQGGPTTAGVPGTCDCPAGDTRGELRNLAAFAPLGLLGAIAAAGGLPAVVVGTPAMRPVGVVGMTEKSSDVVTVEPARNLAMDAAVSPGDPTRPAFDDAPTLLRGVRPPATGTPLPSVFLLGSGLIAIGCVAIIRTRG